MQNASVSAGDAAVSCGLVVSNEKQALLTKLFGKPQPEPPKQEFPVRHQFG